MQLKGLIRGDVLLEPFKQTLRIGWRGLGVGWIL
jgi:hypothetical protein